MGTTRERVLDWGVSLGETAMGTVVEVGGAVGGTGGGESLEVLETPLKIPRERDSLRASRDPKLSSPNAAVKARNRNSSAPR